MFRSVFRGLFLGRGVLWCLVAGLVTPATKAGGMVEAD